MELVAVAAVAENLVIGNRGEIPWPSLPQDRAQYRALVADEPVVMGRRTFASMRDDLPGRAQIVLSRSEREFDSETASHAADPEEAIETGASLGAETLYVIGGAEIYALFLPHLDRMVLSRVPGRYEGDAFFPDWDREAWTLVKETEHDGFTVEEWERTERSSGGFSQSSSA